MSHLTFGQREGDKLPASLVARLVTKLVTKQLKTGTTSPNSAEELTTLIFFSFKALQSISNLAQIQGIRLKIPSPTKDVRVRLSPRALQILWVSFLPALTMRTEDALASKMQEPIWPPN